ncbi:MAG: hypothetical protein AAGH40_07355 [Verrucomicrobiota bacterium]
MSRNKGGALRELHHKAVVIGSQLEWATVKVGTTSIFPSSPTPVI